MDSPVRGASAAGDYGQRFGRQAIYPFIRGDRLAGLGVGAERRPVSLLFDLLVGNRAFHYQDERLQLALFGLVPKLQEIVAIFIGEYRVVQMDARQSGDRAQQNVFNAWLRGGSNGNGIAVAAKTGGDPENMNIRDG